MTKNIIYLAIIALITILSIYFIFFHYHIYNISYNIYLTETKEVPLTDEITEKTKAKLEEFLVSRGINEFRLTKKETKKLTLEILEVKDPQMVDNLIRTISGLPVAVDISPADKKEAGPLSRFKRSVRLGLDLRSGTHLLVELVPNERITAETLKNNEEASKVIATVISVLHSRINRLGTTEPMIQRQGNTRIIIDLPDVTNAEEAKKIISQAGYLEFKELIAGKWEKIMDPKTGVKLDGTVLKTAMFSFDAQSGKPEVNFELNKEGARLFGEATTRNVGKPLGIFLDGKLISSPNVQTPITEGRGVITNMKSKEEAQELAIILQSGALPVNIRAIESVVISPTLGKESLKKSLEAAALGLGFVIIFMLSYYRLPGFFANVALIFYTIVLLAIFVVWKITLTLPGIAAFVLSIGMAVDANVLIFERLKEELWSGKSIKGAVSAGFSRAFSSIFDSHVTTIVGAGVLIYFGSSSIQGFGVALAIGTVLSLVTAVFVTRAFMDVIVDNNLLDNKWLYGVREGDKL